jgi:transcription antitermination factor NusG
MIMKPPAKRLRWYAVRCDKAGSIDKAKKEIAALGVPVFVPRGYREEKRGKWVVSIDDGYLFPPFMFIAMRAPGPWKSRESILWGAVYDIRGVVKVMGNYDREGAYRPCPIPYKEMRKIRTKHQAGERRLADERFKTGQKVKIMAGAFSGFDGIFDKPVKERVSVLVSLFGRQSAIELDENDVRAA